MYNGHGDVVQTVSEGGEIENQYDYDIFGNPTLTVEERQNSIRYAGEFYDTETGLYYLRARYYDAYIGRFISEDSYWGEDNNPLSLNLYTYAYNNPLQYIDPTGHSAYDVGQQQVRDQGKNESQQGLKDKLKAQQEDYEKAVRNNDKEAASLYKGRIDALNDMMSSGSSKSSSSSSRDDRDSSSSKGKTRNDDKVTVSWEGYIIDIDISEYNEYKSHGWSIFNGEAYAENMYNSSEQLHSITTKADSNVRIENRGEIGTINTGEGSTTTISNKGTVGTITTGIGSTTTISNSGKVRIIYTGYNSHLNLSNSKDGEIEEKIETGKNSTATIKNQGKIGVIHTGESSNNIVVNSGHIESLITGLGNHTVAEMNDGDSIGSIAGGQGTLIETKNNGTSTGKVVVNGIEYDSYWDVYNSTAVDALFDVNPAEIYRELIMLGLITDTTNIH